MGAFDDCASCRGTDDISCGTQRGCSYRLVRLYVTPSTDWFVFTSFRGVSTHIYEKGLYTLKARDIGTIEGLCVSLSHLYEANDLVESGVLAYTLSYHDQGAELVHGGAEY